MAVLPAPAFPGVGNLSGQAWLYHGSLEMGHHERTTDSTAMDKFLASMMKINSRPLVNNQSCWNTTILLTDMGFFVVRR